MFMRENLYAASSGGQSAISTYESDQPIAAALTQSISYGGDDDDTEVLHVPNGSTQAEFSSLMKKRLSDFVKKIMQAEIHEGQYQSCQKKFQYRVILRTKMI